MESVRASFSSEGGEGGAEESMIFFVRSWMDAKSSFHFAVLTSLTSSVNKLHFFSLIIN